MSKRSLYYKLRFDIRPTKPQSVNMEAINTARP